MELFIIASNDISLSPEKMLKYYKGQDRVEKGFRFLKGDTLSVHVHRPPAVTLNKTPEEFHISTGLR